MCAQCHGVDTFAQSRMSPEEWKAVVADMIARGASGIRTKSGQGRATSRKIFPDPRVRAAGVGDGARTFGTGPGAKPGGDYLFLYGDFFQSRPARALRSQATLPFRRVSSQVMRWDPL